MSKVISYLGTMEQAKGKLIELLNTGTITPEQFDKFSSGLPEPVKKEPKVKTIVVNENDYTTMQKVISEQAKEIQRLRNLAQQLEHEKSIIRKKTLDETRKERLKLKDKIESLERFITDLQKLS